MSRQPCSDQIPLLIRVESRGCVIQDRLSGDYSFRNIHCSRQSQNPPYLSGVDHRLLAGASKTPLLFDFGRFVGRFTAELGIGRFGDRF